MNKPTYPRNSALQHDPSSIEDSLWSISEENKEVKAHVGLVRDPQKGDLYCAGIETVNKDGDCEIQWHNPHGSIKEARIEMKQKLKAALYVPDEDAYEDVH